MSVDRALREMVADEVARALEPVHAALAELHGNSAVIARLTSALGQPARRGPGRQPGSLFAPTRASGGKRGRKPSEKHDCAVIDCGKPARSKGYCSAHYQKFRMLDRTSRLPRDWVADAAPNSVKNIHLARGRRASNASAKSKS